MRNLHIKSNAFESNRQHAPLEETNPSLAIERYAFAGFCLCLVIDVKWLYALFKAQIPCAVSGEAAEHASDADFTAVAFRPEDEEY